MRLTRSIRPQFGSEAFDAHVIRESLKSFYEMAEHLMEFSTVRNMPNNRLNIIAI